MLQIFAGIFPECAQICWNSKSQRKQILIELELFELEQVRTRTRKKLELENNRANSGLEKS